MAVLRGLNYPPKIENGTLAIAEDEQVIRGHILHICQTFTLERVLRPGLGVQNPLFLALREPDIIGERLQIALETQVQATIQVLTDATVEGDLNLQVNWAVNGKLQTPINFALKGG